MKLTLGQPQLFKDSITVISDLVTEARFTITKESMTLVAMDPANVAMVVYKLFSSSFLEYELNEDVEIALNLNNLKQVLRRVGSSDVMTLSVEDKAKLNIAIKGKSTRRFSLPIIELDDKEQRMPNLQFPYTVTMQSSLLVESVEDAGIISDAVVFAGDSKKLLISSQGDLSKAEIELTPSDDVNIVSETEDVVRSKFSVEYLKKMVNGSKVADQVKLQIAKDYLVR